MTLATLTDKDLGLMLAKAKREHEEAAALFEDARTWDEKKVWRREKRSTGQRLSRLRDEVKRRRWLSYEAGKAAIVEAGLTAEQYEMAIRNVADELGV